MRPTLHSMQEGYLTGQGPGGLGLLCWDGSGEKVPYNGSIGVHFEGREPGGPNPVPAEQ